MFKVVWICGQFNKILNDANIFTTAIEPHGKDKKIESCMDLWAI